MGVFSVQIKVSNWQNQFLPPKDHGANIQCDAIVDTGAVNLALPAESVEKLKLQQIDVVNAYTADGGMHKYRVFGIAEVEVQGRKCQVRVIELPHGAKPLLGDVPLEEMDWHVSPVERKLVPNPESPDKPLLPLC